jgi:hypothetical protein
VGGATQAAASPSPGNTPCGPGQRCDEAPRLDCAVECPTTIVANLGDTGGFGDAPVITTAPAEPQAPPPFSNRELLAAPSAAPAAHSDVLAVAPKTSPPRS